MVKKLIFAFITIFFIMFLIPGFYNAENKVCTEKEAIKIAQEYVKSNNKEAFVNTITNFDSPTAEVEYIERLVTHNEGIENVIRNKECYKVTFNYPLEKFTGPYEVYINYNNGKCYGATIKY